LRRLTKAETKKIRPARTPKNATDKKQSSLILATARQIEADENRSRADELIDRMARTPPVPQTKKGGNWAALPRSPSLVAKLRDHQHVGH
jgi:hypothetical protein